MNMFEFNENSWKIKINENKLKIEWNENEWIELN